MECIVCSSNMDVLYEQMNDKLHPNISGKYNLIKCRNCNIIYIDPQPNGYELQKHYPPEYHVYNRNNQQSKKKMQIIKKIAETFFGYSNTSLFRKCLYFPVLFRCLYLPRKVLFGLILDIGCGDGSRMNTFRTLGWTVEGVEIDQQMSNKLRMNGYTIYTGKLENIKIPNKKYDAIHINHVFEHLNDPHICLQKIYHMLKPDGELIMVVPNGNSIIFKIFGGNWFPLEVPRHLFTYNKKNIQFLLKKHGFTIEKIYFSDSFGSFTSSLAYSLSLNISIFKPFEKITWFIDLLIDPIINFFGVGDSMTIRARRDL